MKKKPSAWLTAFVMEKTVAGDRYSPPAVLERGLEIVQILFSVQFQQGKRILSWEPIRRRAGGCWGFLPEAAACLRSA